MMFHAQGSSRNHCSLLAVLCGSRSDYKRNHSLSSSDDYAPRYPIPQLSSSGRLEVQVLNNPSIDTFRQTLQSFEPNIVYLQGERTEYSEEVGSLRWGDVDLSYPQALCDLFGSSLPGTVYLEITNGEELAEALYSKGVPYIIYWKSTFSDYAALHFRQALCYVMQSSCSHICDAFQLAHASFRLYCSRDNNGLPSNIQKPSSNPGPCLLGEPPKIDITIPETDVPDEESSSDNLPAIKIYDDDVTLRFLVCGLSCTLDSFLLGSLEDGLNALLNIEIRGSKLHNRTSAPPPPLQAGTFSRGVVTMRCDLSTCSSSHISLLVSGSAQTCFNDQHLENHIKQEIIENSQLVHALPTSEEIKASSEPRKSASIACGASVFEVCMKVPTWASQVLRQLAPDVSYRSLVMLGIASIQGLSVASFEKDDAERLLFFCTKREKELYLNNPMFTRPPSWLITPAPSRKIHDICCETRPFPDVKGEKEGNIKRKLNIAAMRPIPHTRRHKMLPFSALSEAERYDGEQVKPIQPVAAPKHSSGGSVPVTHRKTTSSYQAQQIISLNPLPLKKHGCGRAPIHACSEEEFLRDVMQFLILRGHARLVPQGGLPEFPDAILNAKRLDLFNLYREVVSRGGFHVGNGINWKGQVFSKMRNHTLTNRMTGVGNTLKRHYETYLLEYELAHEDVDGECCLLCHSSAAGDWVNCGICGEWAHFGCDRRQGLGAFKDYAKTDGLEYICPHCSITNFKKKSQKTTNGY
ncbi:AT-rich interactive domain-containing protein 4 [Linum perenne]